MTESIPIAGDLNAILTELQSIPSIIPETYRGFSAYAERLGFTEEQLSKLISNKVVMDLGSGMGFFGADVSLSQLPGSSFIPPARLDLIDIRYAYPDYEQRWENKVKKETEEGWKMNISLPEIPGHKRIEIPYNDESAIVALKRSKGWRIAASWKDLSALPADYDEIISSYGFPYHASYSDKQIIMPQYDDQSLKIFDQIISRLKPTGRFIGHTGFMFKDWRRDTEYMGEMIHYFHQRDIIFEIQANQKDEAVIHLTPKSS